MSSASLLRPFPPLENDDAEALVQAFLFVEDAKAALRQFQDKVFATGSKIKVEEASVYLLATLLQEQVFQPAISKGLTAVSPPVAWQACRFLAQSVVYGGPFVQDPRAFHLARRAAEDRRYICELEHDLRRATRETRATSERPLPPRETGGSDV